MVTRSFGSGYCNCTYVGMLVDGSLDFDGEGHKDAVPLHALGSTDTW